MRTLLQKHGLGARRSVLLLPPAWFIAPTWTMREIFWRVRFVNHGSSAVHTLYSHREEALSLPLAKYHRVAHPVSGKYTCTCAGENRWAGGRRNGRYTVDSGYASVNHAGIAFVDSGVLSIARRNTVLILFFPAVMTRVYLRDSKRNNDVVVAAALLLAILRRTMRRDTKREYWFHCPYFVIIVIRYWRLMCSVIVSLWEMQIYYN